MGSSEEIITDREVWPDAPVKLCGGPLDGGEVDRGAIYNGGFVTPIAVSPIGTGEVWDSSDRGPWVVTYRFSNGKLIYMGRRKT
jgi:hypothetical protein